MVRPIQQVADALGGNLVDNIALPDLSVNLAPGTAAGQVSIRYRAQRTLAYNANEALDLTSLTDSQGRSITFATYGIKLLRVQNVGLGTNTLSVGAGSTPVFAAAFPKIPAGGELFFFMGITAAGFPVTGSSAMLLKFLSNGEDATKGMIYNVDIIG
jgi:hypothetical protein